MRYNLVVVNFYFKVRVCQPVSYRLVALQASGANPEVLATFNKTTGFTAKDSRVEHLGGADLRMNNLTAKDDGIVLCSIHFRSGENTPSTVNLKACIHIDGERNVPLAEFLYPVFTRLPGDSLRRRFRSLLCALLYV